MGEVVAKVRNAKIVKILEIELIWGDKSLGLA
jgi:hypothetical protein